MKKISLVISSTGESNVKHFLKRTGLSCDDHGLHDETEKLVQNLMEKEHQRLQAGGGQRDDAQLELVLKHVLRDLLIAHSKRKHGLPFQSVTQSKEAFQVTVL